MTLALTSPYIWPGITLSLTGPPGTTNGVTVDAAGEYHAVIFQARESMTLSHVGFRPSTVAGSGAAELRIETVDGSGLPSGTLWAANTNVTTGALSTNTWALFALTASATIARGDWVCIKILYNAGTSFITSALAGTPGSTKANNPYQVNNTGTPTKSALTSTLVVVGNSSTTFYAIDALLPLSTVISGAFSNTVAGDKRGLRFQVPFTGRCTGIRWYNGSVLGDFNAIIYSDAGSELSSSSTAFDGDSSAATNSAASVAHFDNPVTLTAGTWYRAVIEPTTATTVTLARLTLPSSSYLSATPFRANAHYTSFTTAGSWVDSGTDTIPIMDILFDQLSDAPTAGRTALVNSLSVIG